MLLQANIAQPSARDPVVGDDEEALTAAIIRLASQYGRYGYRRMAHQETIVPKQQWRKSSDSCRNA